MLLSMEAERLVTDLPCTAPFGGAHGGGVSSSFFCAGTSRGLQPIDNFLSSSESSEDASAAESLFSADAKTEQVFFGNFLPLSNGLRCSFMRRCPSAPSGLSAADQQRLLQQQRLHVQLLQLERKVSMQERLLCQVQRSGELPLLMQHQLAAPERTGAADDLHGALPCPQVQFGSEKREDDVKSEFLSLHHNLIFNEKRCLSLAELPSLSLPTHQGSLSLTGATGNSKGMTCATLPGMKQNNTTGAMSGRAETVDDGTPSTAVATAADHSPASDKRTATRDGGDLSKTLASVVSPAVASIHCSALPEQVKTRENSLLAASVHGEDTTVESSSCVSPARRTSEKAGEEDKEAHTAERNMWPQQPVADSIRTGKVGKEAGEADVVVVVKARETETKCAQQLKEREGEPDHGAEAYQQTKDTDAAVSIDPPSALKDVLEVGKKKKSVGQAGSSSPVPNGGAGKEDHEGTLHAAGGRKPEGTRPPDQFFRIKLCAKYFRRTCRKGSRCSYAHAEEELREIPNLRKTKLCAIHKMGKQCPLETACPFAHGEEELRCTAEYYKTKLCKFWTRERRCEAGEGCRHAHGAAELRQRTQRFADLVNGGLPERAQEARQTSEVMSGIGSRPKDAAPIAPFEPPTCPSRSSLAIGKQSGTAATRDEKIEDQKPSVAAPCGKKDHSLKSRGQTDDRHVQARESPSAHNDGDVKGSRLWNDVQAQSTCDQRSSSKTQKRGKVEGERRVSGKGGTVDLASTRGRMRRGGGNRGAGVRPCENAVSPSTSVRERTASALGSATLVFPRAGTGSPRRDPAGKDSRGCSGHGALHHHMGDGQRGESYLQSSTDKRWGIFCPRGTQHATQPYYANREKTGPAPFLPGFATAQEQAEAALHTQWSHMQHPQTHLFHQQKLPMHVAESSALSIANANTSALYGLTAGINPYGPLAVCPQQAPYGLPLLPPGPPSCGNMQTAAAAAAAVAVIAQQQQQQLEAAAKAVGPPGYQSMQFLGPPFGGPFVPSHISFAAPPHPLPAFAASAAAAGGSAAVRSGPATYAASYPTYPYASPAAPSLVGEPNGASAAACVSPCYPPRGISVPCSTYTYDVGRHEMCMPPNQGEDLQPDCIQTDACESEQGGGRFISQSRERSMTTAAVGFPLYSPTFAERLPRPSPPLWGQEDGAPSSCVEDRGAYSDTSASPEQRLPAREERTVGV